MSLQLSAPYLTAPSWRTLACWKRARASIRSKRVGIYDCFPPATFWVMGASGEAASEMRSSPCGTIHLHLVDCRTNGTILGLKELPKSHVALISLRKNPIEMTSKIPERLGHGSQLIRQVTRSKMTKERIGLLRRLSRIMRPSTCNTHVVHLGIPSTGGTELWTTTPGDRRRSSLDRRPRNMVAM
jgi:hypothetical protein